MSKVQDKQCGTNAKESRLGAVKGKVGKTGQRID